MKYLPIEKETLRMPREYVINVLYSVIGTDFKTWIRAQIKERNLAAVEKRDQMVELDPDVALALQQSTQKSCTYAFPCPALSYLMLHFLQKRKEYRIS